ncbi:MAG TPA: ATP-binding protein [Kofleriaceae bacterium]|jgi:signal transduction histidine kinase
MSSVLSSGSIEIDSESARELREKKRVLAALVVHDLRSPLSTIHGYMSLLKEELANPQLDAALIQSYADDAQTLVNKALSLVATILDVDELEDGILHAVLAPVRFIEIVERARVGNRPQFEVRNLTVEVDVDPDLIVRIDRDLFARIVENLVDNSTRYAPRNGRVSIKVRRLEDATEIAIGNSGPPVPESERERIFGRYFQVEARRAAARANRGLGLYFCKLAAEAHGGTIHVEQRGDLGAVFVVRVPDRTDRPAE